MIPEKYLKTLIERSYKEDVGSGDHSSLCCINANQYGKARLIAKQDGVLAGVDVAKKVCKYFASDLKLDIFIKDGSYIKYGDVILEISGSQLGILTTERTMLNFMQRMSGIATETNRYVKLLEGLKTQVLDTRKTTPGLRLIEKEAVIIGGGANHRIGLYDMIMLKDNHIDFAGSIKKAISLANDYIIKNNLDIKIEIETRSIEDVVKIMQVGGVNRIMLDNFNLQDTNTAVKIIEGKYEIESSGGITYDTIRDYAECGVDYISVGALTHQIKSLDLSLIAI